MTHLIHIETDHSTIVFDEKNKLFSGLFQGMVIQNNDLHKQSKVTIVPLRERQRIAHEFIKLGKFDIVLLMNLPTGKEL